MTLLSSYGSASRVSVVIAPSGQCPMHAPEPVAEKVADEPALPSMIWSAPSGQFGMHRPQPVHRSSSIVIICLFTQHLPYYSIKVPYTIIQGRRPSSSGKKGGGRAFSRAAAKTAFKASPRGILAPRPPFEGGSMNRPAFPVAPSLLPLLRMHRATSLPIDRRSSWKRLGVPPGRRGRPGARRPFRVRPHRSPRDRAHRRSVLRERTSRISSGSRTRTGSTASSFERREQFPGAREHTSIEFDGLDTYADVFLNDSLLLRGRQHVPPLEGELRGRPAREEKRRCASISIRP